MAFMQTGCLKHHEPKQGMGGGTSVLYLCGNLRRGEWISLALPQLPALLRIIAPDWRGCGDSDKPTPDPEFTGSSMHTHAEDMLALLDALGIDYCHLANHSAGDFSASRMLLKQPERFGRVLSLAPVGPMGLAFTDQQPAGFATIRDDPTACRAALPTAASCSSRRRWAVTAYRCSATAPARRSGRNSGTWSRAQRLRSDGIWPGSTMQPNRGQRSGGVRALQQRMRHARRILWGDQDAWIPRADMEEMRARLPDRRLDITPKTGTSWTWRRREAYAAALAASLVDEPRPP